MIRKVLVVLCLVLSTSLHAEQLRVPGTDIVFTVPNRFTTLSQDEIDLKFPSKNGPRYAVGNDRRTTTIAYDFKNIAVSEESFFGQIEGLGDSMGRAIPGFVSIERGVRTINGLDWAYFEMTSTAIDADIHNIVLMTPQGGGLVVLNFNSTKLDFVSQEHEIRQSISSLRLTGDG